MILTVMPPGTIPRRHRFAALATAEERAREDVENLARRVLRARREQWKGWLVDAACEELWSALGRLDVTRAQLAQLQDQEGG